MQNNRLERYLRTLTDKQLDRLWRRVWDRPEVNIGGAWDTPTMKAVIPGYYQIIIALNNEVQRRHNALLQSKVKG